MSNKKVSISMPSPLARHLEQLAQIESICQGKYISIAQLVRRAIEKQYDYPNTQVSIHQNGVVSECCKGLSRSLPS